MTGFTPTTDAVRARYVQFPPEPPEWLRATRDHVDGTAFDRWLNTVNPWPALDVRYGAAKAANLGDQLRSEELTERVRIELENAFAAGALWQYERGQTSASTTQDSGRVKAADDPYIASNGHRSRSEPLSYTSASHGRVGHPNPLDGRTSTTSEEP